MADGAGCSGWSFFNPMCQVDQGIQALVGSAIENLANAVMEAFGKAVASLGTVWVHIGTPVLTGSGGSSPIAAGSTAPNASGISTVLGYVMWVSLAVCILSLFILGAVIATRVRSGEGVAAVGRVGLVLAAAVLVSGASALVAAILPSGPRNAGGAVLFLQSSLWWYMGAAAMVSVIIGGARMAWEQRAEPGRETVKGLLTLVVVAGAGVTIVSLLVAAADSFSVWIINGSLSCDVTTDSACFGENILVLLALTTNPATGALGALLIIILGLVAVLAAIFQIVLMVARGGMLVILTGILPLSASFTNTEVGKTWFRKSVGWLIAFILYKPAAAIVYAAAFQLVGTDVFTDDGTGLVAVLTGLMLMIIALFAMPALMRFVTPMVGSIAGGAGAGGALAVGAVAALPSGAASLGRLSTEGVSSGGAGSSGPSGSGGPSGSPGPSGGGSTPDKTQVTGGQQTTAGGNSATSGKSLGGGASGSAGAGASAAGGAGAASGAGAAAGSGAAAGAAGGPVGIAAGAALDVGKQSLQAAAGAAQTLGQESTGEGGGPGGGR